MERLAERTAYAVSPIPRTRLIGREMERATARSLLLDEAVPLLTLTGPGGVGKTRLALALAFAKDAAGHVAGGAVWIDLAPLSKSSLVPGAVARSLGLSPPPGLPAEEALARHLRPRQTLLLLDNREHVLAEAGELVAGLLARCPALQVIATSRAPLRIRGEHDLSVDPLPLPSPRDDGSNAHLSDNPAVRLFVERSRAISSAFAAGENLTDVAEICRRLDGLPLAIELAAAHVRVLSLPALRDRLQQRLPLLVDGSRDAPARQRTIRDTIAWSYDLLAADEQATFRRLSAFSGGFTLEAARAVASGDRDADMLPVLERLVEQNLVRPLPGTDEPRFTMLETIRELGLERLAASGEEAGVRDRHAAHFLELVTSLDAWVAAYLPDSQFEQAGLAAAARYFAAAIEQQRILAGESGGAHPYAC